MLGAATWVTEGAVVGGVIPQFWTAEPRFSHCAPPSAVMAPIAVCHAGEDDPVIPVPVVAEPVSVAYAKMLWEKGAVICEEFADEDT